VDRDDAPRIADVKRMAYGLVLGDREYHSVDDVVHIAPGPYLATVVVHHHILATQRPYHELVHSASAHLPRSIDVERPDGYSRQAEFLVIIVGQVLGRKLADGVRPARFADRPQARHVRLL